MDEEIEKDGQSKLVNCMRQIIGINKGNGCSAFLNLHTAHMLFGWLEIMLQSRPIFFESFCVGNGLLEFCLTLFPDFEQGLERIVPFVTSQISMFLLSMLLQTTFKLKQTNLSHLPMFRSNFQTGKAGINLQPTVNFSDDDASVI